MIRPIVLHAQSPVFVAPFFFITQRQKIFADAAEKGYLVAGAHITYPGIGRLAKEGNGYRWWPLRYVDDAVTQGF